ncbi:MAG: hypothetical protein LBI48_00675 [Burkholderiaceae bacterium]|jgi:hypothetical protein|nr:hypothetical protein [Burkholderiaceae bacterium]
MDALTLINAVAVELQDAERVRWTLLELAGYVNDGQRFILTKVPTATADERTLALVAGVEQAVPKDCFALLDMPRNADDRQTAIRQVARAALDASAPGWAGGNQKNAVIHFIQDPRQPWRFDVYPPVTGGVPVVALLAVKPVLIGEDGKGAITLRHEYIEALRHYLLYRAWSKDAEYGANAQLAAAHYQALADALGIAPARPATANDPTT